MAKKAKLHIREKLVEIIDSLDGHVVAIVYHHPDGGQVMVESLQSLHLTREEWQSSLLTLTVWTASEVARIGHPDDSWVGEGIRILFSEKRNPPPL